VLAPIGIVTLFVVSLVLPLITRSRQMRDDELIQFEAQGAPPLPAATTDGFVENSGARIWYASYGAGRPVVLLHGGLGSSNAWGHLVPALVKYDYRAIVIDSRGHGRSTRDDQQYSYNLMALDVLAVFDTLQLNKAAFVGWSDGACTALVLAATYPQRVEGVFFFACNMDATGTKEFEFTPTVARCYNRQVADYQAVSATPNDFQSFADAVSLMQRTQPNYTATQLAHISVPVTVAQGEHDEFIKRQHAEYLARTIPGAQLLMFPEVSHFAPLQRPDVFNAAVIAFLKSLSR
jgi:pimeloyl-ACP methyl ester carboxylesterase